MTEQIRQKMLLDDLYILYKNGEKLRDVHEYTEQYKDWISKLDKFQTKFADDYLFDLSGVCFSNTCGDMNDVVEMCKTSIESKAINFYSYIMNILKFYLNAGGYKLEDDKTENNVAVNEAIKPKKIFISHSAKDKEIVDQFVNFLNYDLGLAAEKEYFYSSEDGSGVSLGESIDDRLRSELNDNDCLFVAMFSRNYFESYACWFEIGVRWGKGLKLLGIVIDPDENVENRSIDVSKGVRIIAYSSLINSSEVKQEIQDKVFEHLGKQNSPKNDKYSRFYDEFLKLVREHDWDKDKDKH